jgi:hypothetical protein
MTRNHDEGGIWGQLDGALNLYMRACDVEISMTDRVAVHKLIAAKASCDAD